MTQNHLGSNEPATFSFSFYLVIICPMIARFKRAPVSQQWIAKYGEKNNNIRTNKIQHSLDVWQWWKMNSSNKRKIYERENWLVPRCRCRMRIKHLKTHQKCPTHERFKHWTRKMKKMSNPKNPQAKESAFFACLLALLPFFFSSSSSSVFLCSDTFWLNSMAWRELEWCEHCKWIQRAEVCASHVHICKWARKRYYVDAMLCFCWSSHSRAHTLDCPSALLRLMPCLCRGIRRFALTVYWNCIVCAHSRCDIMYMNRMKCVSYTILTWSHNIWYKIGIGSNSSHTQIFFFFFTSSSPRSSSMCLTHNRVYANVFFIRIIICLVLLLFYFV